MGVSFFPRTDAGQFVINVKAPTGTRIELTENYVKRVEDIVHQVVPPDELETIVSNIGLTPDLSSLFTPNSGMHTAFVQVGLKEDHKESSFVYMDQVRARIGSQNSGAAHLLSVRRTGGCGAEPGRSRADRRSGERNRTSTRTIASRRTWRASSGRFPGFPTFIFPRIWTIPRCR